MNRYEQIAKEVEADFSEPKYLAQNIRYVCNNGAAEICVSAQHTMGDYLLVGIRALQRSINGVSGDILVFNDPAPDTEIIGVASDWHAPLRKVKVHASTYLSVCEPIEEIYRCLYKGDMPVAGIGLAISMGMMVEFSDIGNGIPTEIMSMLQFTHFDDVKTAEKDAFTLIKKMSGNILAGSLYAFKHGEED